MSFSHPSGFSRTRSLFLGAVALLAIALTASALAGETSASSGGVGPGGPTKSSSAASADEGKYLRIWDGVPASEKRWAHEVAICESGKDPNATALGGEYRGAFMFLRSTWKTSPKSPGGDPIDYGYKTQAVIAVLLKKQLGTKPWPVCG